jgi:hypothetical protein
MPAGPGAENIYLYFSFQSDDWEMFFTAMSSPQSDFADSYKKSTEIQLDTMKSPHGNGVHFLARKLMNNHGTDYVA